MDAQKNVKEALLAAVKEPGEIISKYFRLNEIKKRTKSAFSDYVVDIDIEAEPHIRKTFQPHRWWRSSGRGRLRGRASALQNKNQEKTGIS